MEKVGRALLHVGVQVGSIFASNPASDELRLQLLQGAREGNLNKIRACLQTLSALPSAELDINSTDAGGRTPLMLACEGGHVHVIELLLETPQVNVNLPTNFGTTALMKLVSSAGADRTIATVEKLLKHKAEPNAHNVDGNTALVCACAQGHAAVAQLLLAYGKY